MQFFSSNANYKKCKTIEIYTIVLCKSLQKMDLDFLFRNGITVII